MQTVGVRYINGALRTAMSQNGKKHIKKQVNALV